MKISKVLLFAALLAILGNSATAAGLSTKVDHGRELQNTIEDEDRNLRFLNKKHHERINWDDELKLSEPQKIYFKEVLQDSRKRIDEQIKIIKDAHKEIEKIYDDDNAKMRKVLTPQQQIKFDRAMLRWQKAHGKKTDGEKPSLKRMRQY